MSTQPVWVDKHGRRTIVPFSDSTVRRLNERETDPFPSARRIAGKNYWRVSEILEWMDRQGEKAAPADTEAEAASDEPAAEPAVGAE